MQPTNDQLRKLLLDLGFTYRSSTEPKCAIFEHPESKACLLLPTNGDGEAAREADVISLRTHLMYRGHLDQRQFDQFLRDGVLNA